MSQNTTESLTVVLGKPKDVLTQNRVQNEDLGHWINMYIKCVLKFIENESKIAP